MPFSEGATVNLSTATPVEIDTELARLYTDRARLETQHGYAANSAHSYNDERATYRGRRRVYTKPLENTLAELEIKLTGENVPEYNAKEMRGIIRQIAELDEKINANQAEIQLIDIEYSSRPWTRFIAVENGHLHSGTRCAGGTIRVTTQIGWHPELSGKTEADAVAELGPLLCTHCFPTAPVEWTVGPAVKKVADGYCEGQGQQGENLQMQYMSPRGNCPVCKQKTGISKTGKVLKHKLAKD